MVWNFSFVIPGKLAGLARPGSQAPLESDLRELRSHGIGALVSLTPAAPDPEAIRAAGLEHLHLPVIDFSPPTREQIDAFVTFAKRQIGAGSGVAVHCAAGYGRTGTMLACYLVALGESPEEAVESVRSIRPGSIETDEQERCVQHYAEYVRARTSANP